VHGVEEQRDTPRAATRQTRPPSTSESIPRQNIRPTSRGLGAADGRSSWCTTLERYGYKGRHGLAYIQSFEVSNLKALARMTQLPLVQLIDATRRALRFRGPGHDPAHVTPT